MMGDLVNRGCDYISVCEMDLQNQVKLSTQQGEIGNTMMNDGLRAIVAKKSSSQKMIGTRYRDLIWDLRR